MEVLAEKEINGVSVKVVKGDITKEKTDAIVNAANKYLSHGGGVAGAIVRAGGYVIQEESDKIVREHGPLETGEAVITTAGSLPSKFVIHTVGPIYGEGDEDAKLRKAVLSVLKLATEKNLHSISIPAISCGIYGFPKKRGTKIIYETVKEFLLGGRTSLKEVHLIGIEREIPNLFKEAMQND
ncbi:MAG: macro domain-containing protein [Caldisericaceae bacterium]|nr:macro domain-containing protein [Caldisericaceae bacterium]